MAYEAGAVVGLVDAALCALLAGLVLWIDAARRANRALSLLLVTEGTAQLGVAGNILVGDAGPDGHAFRAVFIVAVALLPAFYLLVVAELDTPFARSLRHARTRVAVIALAIALAGYYLVKDVGDAAHDGSGQVYPLGILGAAMLVGLALGVWAWLRAPRGSGRARQATAFVLAFGVRDALFLGYLLPVVLGWDAPWDISPFEVALPFWGTLFFLPLLAYGILHAQLFDIDLRVKRGIRWGAVASAFGTVFFLATELADVFLDDGTYYVGVAASAALLLVIAPLQRAAERLSQRAMPTVAASTEYLTFRKLEVYKAAVESAHESGGISDKERETLARLRAKLAIPEEAARAVERDVVGAAA